MTSDNNITMDEAIRGLARFFRDCTPHRITWGIIHRTEFTSDGVVRLNNIITKLKQNSALAKVFLDHHNPNDLERRMVAIFQETTNDFTEETIAHREYILQALAEQRSIEERVEAYEQAAMYIPPLRQEQVGDDLPF